MGGLWWLTYCSNVECPSGLTWTFGSPNPRMPAMVPKYYSVQEAREKVSLGISLGD